MLIVILRSNFPVWRHACLPIGLNDDLLWHHFFLFRILYLRTTLISMIKLLINMFKHCFTCFASWSSLLFFGSFRRDRLSHAYRFLNFLLNISRIISLSFERFFCLLMYWCISTVCNCLGVNCILQIIIAVAFKWVRALWK